MATKKKSTSKSKSASKSETASSKQVKQLKASIARLDARLERSEAKAAGWKDKARSARAEASSAQKKVAKLEKKAARQRQPAQTPGPTQETTSEPAPQSTSVSATGDRAAATPDATWTVARLRGEARDRGLTGMSNKPKAELLAALR